MGKRKVHFEDGHCCGYGTPACGETIRVGREGSITKCSRQAEEVTCARCRRTKAYRDAVKAAEEKKG